MSNKYGMTGLTKRGEKYLGEFRDNKRHPQRKFVRLKSRTPKDARAEYQRMLGEWGRGEYDPWEKTIDMSATLDNVIDLYLHAHKGQAKGTLTVKRNILRSFNESCNARYPSAITEKDVKRYVERGKKEATRSQYKIKLSHFFKWCIDAGYMDHDPTVKYWRKYIAGTSKRERVGAYSLRKKALTVSQISHIEDQVALVHATNERMSHEWFPDLIHMYVGTGMRRSELPNVRIGDVNVTRVAGQPVKGTIRIRESKTTTQGRVALMTPRAAIIADRWLSEAKTEDPNAHLFVSPNKYRSNKYSNPFSASMLTWRFTTYRNWLGLGSDVTLHSTRHTFITWCKVLNVAPHLLSEITGQSVQMQERYTHYLLQLAGGDIRSAYREILTYCCPGVDPMRIESVLPEEGQLNANINMTDALFSGALYTQWRQA